MGEITRDEWDKRLAAKLKEGEEIKGQVYVCPDDRRMRAYFPLFNRLVTEDLIRHYAEAMGDPNPLYRDPAYAKNTRWGGIIGPPTFDFGLGQSIVERINLDEVPGIHPFYAETRRVYHRAFRPGEEFKAQDRYLGLVEKSDPKKPYRMFFQENERTFVNQRDEIVAVCVGKTAFMAIPPGGVDAVNKTVYANKTKKKRFTNEEVDALHQHYEDELDGKLRRGALVRYWEDTNEGEEMQTLIKGPLDIVDTAACAAACGWLPWEGAFAMKWKLIKASAIEDRRDPETGDFLAPIMVHFSDAFAQGGGMPFAICLGAQNEMNIGHLISNWMGDDGILKSFNIQHRGTVFMGDMTYQKGKVARKYVENGEHLVDLNLWAETHEGMKYAFGSATVKLVAKEY